jgi:hypothetical protein
MKAAIFNSTPSGPSLVIKDGIAYDSAKLFDSIKGRYDQY